MALVATFERVNPEARAWAKRRSAALVVEIAAETREAIMELIEQGFIEHVPPAEMARLLRSVVGLTRKQTRAVWNLKREALANPGGLLRRGLLKFRVPASGAKGEWLDKAVARYAARLLNYRTNNIARSETMVASNEGQRLLWSKGVKDGTVDPETDERGWIATPKSKRTCAICRFMHGKRAPIDGEFTLPDGTKVRNAHAHPGCRCAEGLFERRERMPSSRAALRKAIRRWARKYVRDKEGQFSETGGVGTGEAALGGLTEVDLEGEGIRFYISPGDDLPQYTKSAEVALKAANEALGSTGAAIVKDAAAIGRDIFPNGTVNINIQKNAVTISTRGLIGEGGSMIRSYKRNRNGELEVDHDYFEIPRERQGQGNASRMMSNSLESYERNGVKSITTVANIDVGGYAWAKQGFRSDGSDFLEGSGVKANIRKHVKDPVRREALLSEAKKRGDQAPGWLAEQPEGKKLLMGLEYDAYLDLGSDWGREASDRIKSKYKGKK